MDANILSRRNALDATHDARVQASGYTQTQRDQQDQEDARIADLIAAAILRAVYGPAPQTSTPTPTTTGTPRPAQQRIEARQETDR